MRISFSIRSRAGASPPPIYSRASALIGVVAWLAALIGVLLVTAALVSGASGVGRPDAIFTGGLIASFSYLVIQIQDIETFDRHRFLNSWLNKKRPRWMLAFFFAVFGGIHAVNIDWSPALADGLDWKETLTLLLWTLLALMAAIIVTLATEMLFQAGSLVSGHLRGWKKAPLEGWDSASISKLVSVTSDFGRWPKPLPLAMSSDQAQAYALLATTISNRRWVIGQLLVLIAGGGLGTSLASWATWDKDDVPMYAAILSTLVGLIGLSFSLISVQTWEERAKAYREFAQKEAAPPKQGSFSRLLTGVRKGTSFFRS